MKGDTSSNLRDIDHKPRRFPEGFLWGAATSSHQVEGGNANDWTDWEAQPGRIRDGSNTAVACDHYRRYAEDFDMAAALGHNAHRFSLEWSRIEPEEGRWDMAAVTHYREVLLALHARGLRTMVTAWHFSLPKWVAARGGWEHPEAPRLFARYCAFVAGELGDLVDLWSTINEPMVYLSMGYLEGTWPPGRRRLPAAWRTFNNLVRGHRLAYATMHAKLDRPGERARVGIAQNCQAFEPYRSGSPLDRLVVRLADWFYNHAFFRRTGGAHDYIGVNYYFHNRLKFVPRRVSRFFYETHNENREVSDLGWEIHPEGMYRAIMDMRRYGRPIYVTENGVASADDRLRTAFITAMVGSMHRALRDGADVRGYFHWSLIDNFEWDKGYGPRFGLVAIDYTTQRRTPRPSAYLYKEICEANSLPDRQPDCLANRP